MTPEELYALLEKAGVEFEVVEIFEGARTLRVVVNDNYEEWED